MNDTNDPITMDGSPVQLDKDAERALEHSREATAEMENREANIKDMSMGDQAKSLTNQTKNAFQEDWDQTKSDLKKDWEQTKRDLHIGGNPNNKVNEVEEPEDLRNDEDMQGMVHDGERG